MRIAVMGAGGLGGFYGGKLVKHGEAVTFIARGEHLTAIQNTGLRLIGDKEKILLKDVNATSNPRDIGPVDLILFCVKLYDVESAAAMRSHTARARRSHVVLSPSNSERSSRLRWSYCESAA